MEISNYALNLLKELEGFRSHAYTDQAGVWTIGYGTTTNVKAGAVVTEEDAATMLQWDVKRASRFVTKTVKVPLKQHEFDALVLFTYNVGHEALFRSTLLKKLNAKRSTKEVAKEFARWNKIRINGRVVVSNGLSWRRECESCLFLGLPQPVRKK